jgi:hypothetical protein
MLWYFWEFYGVECGYTPCEYFSGDLPLTRFCFARTYCARARTLSSAHVVVFPMFMFRSWSVRDVALRPMLASHGRACVRHWRCWSAAPFHFTGGERGDPSHASQTKHNAYCHAESDFRSSGVLFLTQSPARLASPPCCPLVSLSSEESPCNIRESVSHAFSPSSSHSHTHTQLLSKPSQATTSSPSLKQALRYQRDHFTHTHTHTYNPHHGLLHQQPVRLCLRCC